MPQSSDDVLIETPDWVATHAAVHRELRSDGRLAMLRHPGFPFVASIRDDGNDLRPLLFEVANRYLERIPELAALAVAPVAGGEQPLDFGWLALRWGDPRQPEPHDPRGSFWLRRVHCRGATADRSAVLLAGNRWLVDGTPLSLGGSVGLRVVLHVAPSDGGRSRVRASGLSTAGLEDALGQPLADLTAAERPQRLLNDFDTLRRTALAAAQRSFGFSATPALDGLVPQAGQQRLRLSGTGRRGPAEDGRVYSWSATLVPGSSATAMQRHLVEQTTHLDLPIEVFRVDPTSNPEPPASLVDRRPTRAAEILDEYRDPTALLPAPVGDMLSLADTRIEVTPARVGQELDPAQPSPQQAPDRNPALRSDDLSAVHAYVRGRELFQRFDAYGLDTGDYFRMARLPLRFQHRASFPYASNGETVNARVRPDDQGQSLFDAFAPQALPQLQVSFGCANLTHREVHDNHAGHPRAQPLGLAGDRRWAWHEFGHVLNFASTGELEFRFAHSAGDALAAVIADPGSPLRGRLRELTFPWVMLTRSHARPARLGWCWCGQRSKLRLAQLAGPPPIPGGYFEEQLMSSSLYRLYRVIGGRRASGLERQRSASDYLVYLVMRAIALLGPATLVPAQSADQFVSALIDADIGTGDWVVAADWPEGEAPRTVHRVGGAVHKAIRWAFEQQGLYATDDPGETREGPGLPPAVDIHIPGRGRRNDGSYEPVGLSWSTLQPQDWHADADSISPNGGAALRVRVGNRGSDTATGVGARAWVCPAGASPLAWQPLNPSGPPVTQNIGPAGWRTFSFEPRDGGGNPLAGSYLVLAEASCPADRANTDPAAALPCGAPGWWSDPALLTDLVANDNNLGLRIVHFA